ncbi:hypothetical protein [Streptomyces sp. NPDC014995]|uniref:hypothetical protein n=1 Tax=Streptomyces sp. NPDC014995 TaxID=3364936 RepID=UPI0036FF9842
MTAGWCSRTLRAAVFAAVCVLLAALGHVLMSGDDVPAGVLGAGLAVTGGTGWCLAGRERGLPLIVAVVVAAQTALHSAFSLGRPASGSTGSPGGDGPATAPVDSVDSMDMGTAMAMGYAGMGHPPVSHPGMSHTGMGSVDHLGHVTGGVGSSFAGMLAAHLLAALLTGLWLAYGEKAAFRILRAVAGRLAAPLRLPLALPAVPDRPRLRPRRPRSERNPGPLLLVHAIVSRGPPWGPLSSDDSRYPGPPLRAPGLGRTPARVPSRHRAAAP